MTLSELRLSIGAAKGEQALRFRFPADVPGPGYLLTELRHAHLSSIDCGHHRESRDEAVMQLILGGKSSLTLDRFLNILTEANIPAGAEIIVEAAPDAASLRLYTVQTTLTDDVSLTLSLAPKRPVCAFAQRRAHG